MRKCRVMSCPLLGFLIPGNPRCGSVAKHETHNPRLANLTAFSLFSSVNNANVRALPLPYYYHSSFLTDFDHLSIDIYRGFISSCFPAWPVSLQAKS